MSLVQRSLRSITWISFFGILSYPVGIVQSILLARLLPVETFGVFVGISSVVNISYILFDFGLTNAFIHRSPETQNEDQAAATLFSLRLCLDSAWAVILLAFGSWIYTGDSRLVLVVLVTTAYLNRITVTPRAILTRQVQHRRLALIDLAVSISTALISVLVAAVTHSIWALLTSSILTFLVTITGFYFINPVWRPRLIWQAASVRYFFAFGGKTLVNNILDTLMENIDNLWTRHYLGDEQLGYYSRAYKFAIYPRLVLALPINAVLVGTFAELKSERARLSKAFFRISVVLTRAGFLLAGGLAIVAPEFISLFLGEKWLPILEPFRILLVFALVDPLRMTVSSLFIAAGQPQKMSYIRLSQLLAFVLGLFTLGTRYGVLGVALSLDIVALLGLALSLVMVRSFVDFSLPRLTLPPLAALGAGLVLAWLWVAFGLLAGNPWVAFIAKGMVFCLGYGGMITLLEGKVLLQATLELIQQMRAPINR